ncbi:cell division control protein 14, SIN component-domain-containing protein [Mrakia frigida]|uniref:cell division control protein 14, SIN component-domain-containing protein n=1 Tax=Mrakia frigida TaxID=29902 RepID=UPI003FCC09FE
MTPIDSLLEFPVEEDVADADSFPTSQVRRVDGDSPRAFPSIRSSRHRCISRTLSRRRRDLGGGGSRFRLGISSSSGRRVESKLASLRSSSARKLRALNHLDGLLATLCIPKPHETREETEERTRVLRVFVKLQDGMDGNDRIGKLTLSKLALDGLVVSRLLPLIARLLPILHTQLVQKAHFNRCLLAESDEVLHTTLMELSAVLQVVQGLSLLHAGSRDLVGKRSSMEEADQNVLHSSQVILDLFLLTRHLPSSTQPEPSAFPSSSSSSHSAPLPTPLASSLLDTLFCALADSPTNTRVFEEAGGLETVMRVLKKHGVRKDVR